jgi:hypothetical protein
VTPRSLLQLVRCASTTLGWVALLARCREDDTMRRIQDAIGVDPIDFESGYPKPVWTLSDRVPS